MPIWASLPPAWHCSLSGQQVCDKAMLHVFSKNMVQQPAQRANSHAAEGIWRHRLVAQVAVHDACLGLTATCRSWTLKPRELQRDCAAS